MDSSLKFVTTCSEFFLGTWRK